MIRARRQRGFSITELMVAMTLGLLVLAGVSTVLVNSRKNYTIQDSLARLQENARFAMQFLITDLRKTGHFGCSDDITSVFDHVNGGAGSAWDTSLALEGYEDGSAQWKPSNSTYRINPSGQTEPRIEPGTDAITIRYTGGDEAIPVEPPYMPQESAALHIATGNKLKKGDIVAVTDCSSADVFQITGPDDPDNTGTLNHNTGQAGVTPGNATKPLSKTYEEDSFIMRYVFRRYFIGRRNNDPDNSPALFVETLGTDNNGNNAILAQEIVDGIENLQILYGEDTINNDRVPDLYRDANTVSNWDNVVAIRITLLAYSIASATEKGAYGAGSDPYGTEYDLGFLDAAADKVTSTTGPRKRRRFTTTVLLRNLQ